MVPDMIIRAYMPVFEEADVLPFVIAHMREQGVEIHALDGWSTDGSYELLRGAGSGVTVERFPADGPSPVQTCRAILARIEDLASKDGADWCYLSDADEWRRSPRSGEALAEGIARVDAEGWNAIDHKVFAFFCVDREWSGDPESYFRHYNTTDMICGIPQQKLWKNQGQRVALGSGHLIHFLGVRMCPEKFVMKHYPYRNPVQAERKVRTRLERRCHAEHRAGWGVHYDAPFPAGFLWDRSALMEWRDTGSPLP